MKVLSARGAERRPIPRAVELSRAAPPPKVFLLRPPPGTILDPRPSKYLPPAGRRDHSKAPPEPRGLPRARTRSPTPARSPFADGGHPARRLEAYALPTDWDETTAAEAPHHKSAPVPISSLACSASYWEARRLRPAQDSSRGSSCFASRVP